MARFLCTVWPFSGHLYPTIAVAHALRARGHEVAFYSGGAAGALVEGEGFKFFRFDRVAARLQEVVDGVAVGRSGQDDAAFYERLTHRYSTMYYRKPLRRRLGKASYFEMALGTVAQQVDDLDAFNQQWTPDVIVTDPSVWGPTLIYGELRDIPVAVFAFQTSVKVPGFENSTNERRSSVRYWYRRAPALAMKLALDLLAADVRRYASSLRQRYGLSPLQGPLVSLYGRMPLFLSTMTAEYDYNRTDIAPTAHYVGACLWDRPRGTEPAVWLRELSSSPPVIYVTEGTSHVSDAILLQAAARGLADLPVQVVVTTGKGRDAASLGLASVASNVRVEQFVPHTDLFPKLSAVVTNGGSNTVRAALDAGVPLVVAPMEWDQFENAKRVAASGAGVRLDISRLTPQRLCAAVEQVLADPTFRQNASRLGDASKRCGGPARAAELLESLLPAADVQHTATVGDHTRKELVG